MEIISEIEDEFKFQMDKYKQFDFYNFCNIIKNSENNIYTIGVGKSENMAKHFCDLLKSISININNLNLINLLHGDIGILNENDIIFLFSNSGNTIEIINLIPNLRQKKTKIFGICSNDKSKFKDLCDHTFILPFNCEISGEINKIPTNSCMSFLTFTNIIVSILKQNINIDKYKSNHPAGNIGSNLLKINDKIIFDYPKVFKKDLFIINDLFIEMTKYKIGAIFILNEDNTIFGMISDGDIRRFLIDNINYNIFPLNKVNQDFYYENDLDKFIIDCKKYIFPVLSTDRKIIGIVIR